MGDAPNRGVWSRTAPGILQVAGAMNMKFGTLIGVMATAVTVVVLIVVSPL